MEYWTLGQYPLATLAHWGQGIVAGALIGSALRKKDLVKAFVAFMILLMFAIYEVSEMADIHDHAYIDLFNCMLFVWFGYVAYEALNWLSSGQGHNSD